MSVTELEPLVESCDGLRRRTRSAHTMVSPVTGDGRPGQQCARVDGADFRRARPRKNATHPELSGNNGSARLVDLACEVGGRGTAERHSFLSQLAKAKVRHEHPAIRASARHSRLRRWSSILACVRSNGADAPTFSTSEAARECSVLWCREKFK